MKISSAKTLQKLIDECVSTSNANFIARNNLDEYCEKNYGYTASDEDIDSVLDLVYGYNGACAGMSAENFDRCMKERL